MVTYYECGICDHLHPIDFTGDCRDDSNRFTNDVLTFDDTVITWEDRLAMDAAEGEQGLPEGA